MKILGIGYCAADILINIRGDITFDRKIPAQQISIQGGGPVATAMVALARWGAKVTFAGSIGDDLTGKYIIENFHTHHINTDYIKITKNAYSSLSICISHSNGLRTILYSKGNVIPLKKSDIKKLNISEFDAIELDGHQPEAQLHVLKKAKELSIPTVLDAGSYRREIMPLVNLSDHIIASEPFASSFWKSFYRSGKRKFNLHQVCRLLFKKGVKAVVITAGEKGSVGYDGKSFIKIPSLKVKVVDTVGAGDVYHAGYIYGLCLGWSLEKCMKFATIAAGLKCRAVGGQAPIPSVKEINKYMGKKQGTWIGSMKIRS